MVRTYRRFTDFSLPQLNLPDFLLNCLISLPRADIDECNERAIACPGLNEACINEEGSFHCDCADGFIRRDSICVENKPPG